jgi:hypothetical protein
MTQWKLVPVTPDQSMCQAGQWKANEWRRFPLRIGDIWQAMLAAAPAPDVQPVAWMSPNRERLEFSRNDTVYGSHTIPLYANPPANDVAELVEALRRLEEVASDCDIGYMDNALRHARVVLDKWEGK